MHVKLWESEVLTLLPFHKTPQYHEIQAKTLRMQNLAVRSGETSKICETHRKTLRVGRPALSRAIGSEGRPGAAPGKF